LEETHLSVKYAYYLFNNYEGRQIPYSFHCVPIILLKKVNDLFHKKWHRKVYTSLNELRKDRNRNVFFERFEACSYQMFVSLAIEDLLKPFLMLLYLISLINSSEIINTQWLFVFRLLSGNFHMSFAPAE
jgi:hypothetical protein